MLFATPRSGSTWVMELLASQPGFKFYDEPFNPRRENVQKTGLFQGWGDFLPESGNDDLFISFLHDLTRNRRKVMNPPPFRRNHRLFTNRIVFKIHALEHMINRVKEELNGKILLLVRHPISTTQSRNVLPRLNYFINSTYYNDLLTDKQKTEIKKIDRSGNDYERGVLSWCYRNLVPLKHADRSDQH